MTNQFRSIVGIFLTNNCNTIHVTLITYSSLLNSSVQGRLGAHMSTWSRDDHYLVEVSKPRHENAPHVTYPTWDLTSHGEAFATRVDDSRGQVTGTGSYDYFMGVACARPPTSAEREMGVRIRSGSHIHWII